MIWVVIHSQDAPKVSRFVATVEHSGSADAVVAYVRSELPVRPEAELVAFDFPHAAAALVSPSIVSLYVSGTMLDPVEAA